MIELRKIFQLTAWSFIAIFYVDVKTDVGQAGVLCRKISALGWKYFGIDPICYIRCGTEINPQVRFANFVKR